MSSTISVPEPTIIHPLVVAGVLNLNSPPGYCQNFGRGPRGGGLFGAHLLIAFRDEFVAIESETKRMKVP